jgi:hypothetical protein
MNVMSIVVITLLCMFGFYKFSGAAGTTTIWAVRFYWPILNTLIWLSVWGLAMWIKSRWFS